LGEEGKAGGKKVGQHQPRMRRKLGWKKRKERKDLGFYEDLKEAQRNGIKEKGATDKASQRKGEK